jgi:hypothetical protein
VNQTKILSRFTKGSVTDDAVIANQKTFEAEVAKLEGTDLLPVAKLYGFTSAPPRPGDTAAWTSKDWVEWCDANNMKTSEKAKRGLKISHYSFPWLVVCPSDGGDFRGAMNCAADFRKLWTSTMTDVRSRIRSLGFLAFVHGIRVDREVPSFNDILDLAAQLNNSDVDNIYLENKVRAFTYPRDDAPQSEMTTISVNKLHGAITYIARSREPQISYVEAAMRALSSVEDGSAVIDSFMESRENAELFIKSISSQRRQGVQDLKVPVSLAAVADVIIAHAEAMRDDADVERAARSAEREAERLARLAKREEEARAAEKTTANRVEGEIKRAKDQFIDVISRFNHEIGSIETATAALRSRVAKATENVSALKFADIAAVLQQQTEQNDAALSRIKVLEETVSNYEGSMQAIAELLGIDPKASELSTKIKDAIGNSAMEADVYKQRLMEFAAEVHSAVSAKEFLALAGNIAKLLPKAEHLALTAGDE